MSAMQMLNILKLYDKGLNRMELKPSQMNKTEAKPSGYQMEKSINWDPEDCGIIQTPFRPHTDAEDIAHESEEDAEEEFKRL